jgi:hypothetical protein
MQKFEIKFNNDSWTMFSGRYNLYTAQNCLQSSRKPKDWPLLS